ncbi:TonB-dependent receptor [Flammeovirga sp. MY04]|uniref:outer membrane beta-barrel protein n=1 Tax=Flammeovirga sp. MY04 TaxID=1191459 RepID=UPI00080636E4|nr:outer membrane beta-barrel protein [Flammeovirga sp. MY04]ANQ48018.1 TonB-dependent receptor [Flammeovirga sp. MY04]
MRYLLLILFHLCVFTSHAQHITGVVLDQDNEDPLPYVNVALVKNDSILSMTITDFDGNFDLEVTQKDTYVIRFLFTGYKHFERALNINDDLNVSLGKIKLESTVTELEGVTVTAERENVNMTSEGMSFNVDSDGGTDMEDIISSMPSISMDENGEVSANGESVVILVNGEETDIENPLEDIPMQLIDRVELLNNPPAEFTSATAAINIVLKEDVKLGNHLRALIEGGSPTQHKANINYSMSKNRWSSSINAGYRHQEMNYYRENERLNYNNNQRSSTRDDLYKTTNYHVNWNSTYAFSPNDKLRFNVSYQRKEQDNRGDENEYLFNVVGDPNYRNNYRTILNKRNSDRIRAQLNYDKNFMQEGRKFQVRLRYSMDEFEQYNGNTTNTEYLLDSSWKYNDARITERSRPSQNYFVSVKYVHPFNDRSVLTTGFRNSTTVQTIDESFYNLATDGTQTERGAGKQDTDYLNQRFSGYTSWKYSFYNDWNFRAGVSVENSKVESNIVQPDTTFNTNNNFWVINPNFNLSKKFNEKWMGNIFYTFRLTPPSDRALNPTINDNNPLFISFGNPNLSMQKFQKLNIQVTNQQEKVSTRVGLFYRNLTDGVERVYETKGDTIIATYGNIVNKHTLGTNFYVHWHLAKNQSLILSADVYNDIYNQRIDETLPTSEWMLSGKLTYKAKFFNHYRLRVVGYYTSERIEYNGTVIPASGVDISMSRYIANRKGKLWVVAQDVFQTRTWFSKTRSPQFESTSFTDLPSVVRLGMSWSFYGG